MLKPGDEMNTCDHRRCSDMERLCGHFSAPKGLTMDADKHYCWCRNRQRRPFDKCPHRGSNGELPTTLSVSAVNQQQQRQQHSVLGSACCNRDLRCEVSSHYPRQAAPQQHHYSAHLSGGQHHHHHHHSSTTLHHIHTTSSMATSLFVVLVALASLFVHRCSGVVVYGAYECRSTRPTAAAIQQSSDGSVRAEQVIDHVAGFQTGGRQPSRVPISSSTTTASPPSSTAAGKPHVYSKGEFTNARYNPFQSPRTTQWPNHYFPNMDCWFNFTAPHGHLVYVEFPTVRIEGDSSMCHWDRDLLTIPTRYTGDKLICGSPTDYGASVTGLQTVNIHFKSNHVIEAAGFSGYFFAYPDRRPAAAAGRRRRRAVTDSMMQRLRRWIANPYIRMLLKEQLFAREDDDDVEAIMGESDLEVVQRLRQMSLNGRTSVRETGCQDCRIAQLLEPCECAGIVCKDNPSAEGTE
ncbi:uncharacterized protein LOC135817176 isoform X2 [Sycon ciliatum]|uniref:uncharacterized protein LOC135817176 isoform X2 n=1 Tax=Sycon ciliatum TaxID=27933 RepID=UPI0031F6017A